MSFIPDIFPNTLSCLQNKRDKKEIIIINYFDTHDEDLSSNRLNDNKSDQLHLHQIKTHDIDALQSLV
jgi:hypothetical protein